MGNVPLSARVRLWIYSSHRIIFFFGVCVWSVEGSCAIWLMFGKHGMNSQFAVLDSAKDYLLASSAVFRRQQFLIRSLGGYTDQSQQKIMQQTKALGGTALEADAEHILRAITPPLDRSKHKGQAGELP